jgi:hypothetical protein
MMRDARAFDGTGQPWASACWNRTVHERALDSVATLARDRLHHQVLKTLRDFLDRVGEPWWAEWVQIRLEDGRFPAARQTSPPQTLDDLVLGSDRIDRVPPHLLPWANSVLDCLRCLLRQLEADRAGSSRADHRQPGPSQRCLECVARTAAQAGEDTVHSVVRRSVQRACRDGRFEHLLILGRLEADECEAGEPRAADQANP